MVRRVVVVSETPFWFKFFAVIAILVLIKIAIVVAIMVGASVLLYRAVPTFSKFLIALGLGYILFTQFPLLGAALAIVVAVLLILWLVGRGSSKNGANVT